MKLKAVEELGWRLYQNGKAYANNQHIDKGDFGQRIKLAFADGIRQRYYESMKMDEFGSPDYSFTSPLLSRKRFKLGSTDEVTKARRCDMGEIDLYRMPKNSHFTGIYPIGTCKNDEIGEITQVKPGEESFYVNDSDFSDIMFFVVKGRGIDVYNVPDCIDNLDIETTYDVGDNTELESSLASVVLDQVLGIALGIKKQYYSDEAQRQIEDQNVIK